MEGKDGNEGFIPLYRSYFQHEFWTEKRTLSKAEAWLWLLYQARYTQKPGKRFIGRKLITWQRGEIAAALSFLCKAWQWPSTSAVNHFLKYLVEEEMIHIDSSQGVNVISIAKHADYNPHLYPPSASVPLVPNSTKPSANAPLVPNQTNTNKEYKELTTELIKVWNTENTKASGRKIELRSITSRIPQVKARSKTFSKEEMVKAIMNRAWNQWIIDNNQGSNWDAIFKSDKNFEDWLHRTPETAAPGTKKPRAIRNPIQEGFLPKPKAEALADQYRKSFSPSNFDKILHHNQEYYKPLFKI